MNEINHKIQKLLKKVKGGDKIIEVTNGCKDLIANNNFAIRWTSANGHLEIVELLLKTPDVYPSANNNEALLSTIRNRHYKIAKLLLENEKMDRDNDDYVSMVWYLMLSQYQSNGLTYTDHSNVCFICRSTLEGLKYNTINVKQGNTDKILSVKTCMDCSQQILDKCNNNPFVDKCNKCDCLYSTKNNHHAFCK